MSRKNQSESDCSVEFVKVLKSERIDKKNRMDLRVAKWKRAKKPVVEKRRIWEHEDGDRPTKMVGLNAEDLRYLHEHYADIINIL